MSQYGRVEYYDPEDVGLIRLRQQRPQAEASRSWGAEPIAASVDGGPRPDDERDGWTHGDVKAGTVPADATTAKPPPAARAAPRAASGDDLTSLDLVEFASWCALVYLPARFNVWLTRRREATSQEGRSP